MRITGGRARSIQLDCPKSSVVRPAMDRIRESVFSSLGASVKDSRVLDLFAGVGSYGLEALSRGALSATFVEQNRQALRSLQSNLQKVEKSLQTTSLGKIIAQSVERFLKLPPARAYDLIFIDPPYEQIPVVRDSLLQQLSSGFVSPGHTRVIFEMPELPEFLPRGWTLLKSLGKGREDARVVILMYSSI